VIFAALWFDEPGLRWGAKMRGQAGFFDVDERLKQGASAANNFCRRPRWLQRFKTLNGVLRGLYSSGTARHSRPSRNQCRISLITRRSSTFGLPPRSGSKGSMAAHCKSLNQKSSAVIQALQRASNQTTRSDGYRYTP
jgi:hypothetical protein